MWIPVGGLAVATLWVPKIRDRIFLLTSHERICCTVRRIGKWSIVNSQLKWKREIFGSDFTLHYLTDFPDLDKALVWKRNVDADQCDQPRELLLLVVFNGFSVYQDLGYSLDDRDEGHKVMPEFGDIKDIEEDIELSLLWEATPAMRPWVSAGLPSMRDTLQDITLDICEVERRWSWSRHYTRVCNKLLVSWKLNIHVPFYIFLVITQKNQSSPESAVNVNMNITMPVLSVFHPLNPLSAAWSKLLTRWDTRRGSKYCTGVDHHGLKIYLEEWMFGIFDSIQVGM